MQDAARRLIDDLEPLAQAAGLELVTVELAGSQKAPTIRIYLDAPGGIGFDQIMSSHEWIDAYLEEADPFPGAYTLEVSSPGIDRPLRKRADFDRFSGEEVVVLTREGGKRKKYSGTLLGMRDDSVVIADGEGVETLVDFDAISKAHIVGKIDF